MKVSAVCCGRNDNYGGFLNERATYSFNSMLKAFDEVIYVDWNTDSDKNVLTDDLKLENRDKLKVIKVTPEMVNDVIGDEPAQKMCEVMARNVGIRRATGDIIVNTNVDIICPPKEQLQILVKKVRPDEMLVLSRMNIQLEHLQKAFGDNVTDIQEHMPLVFGIEPLGVGQKIMAPTLTMTKEVISQYPEETHHRLASVVTSCGDFQVAHKDLLMKIRGFEESQKKRNFSDTTIQYKVIMSGGMVTGTNFPPIYHIDHERDMKESSFNSRHSMSAHTTNDENWGCWLKIDHD